MTKPKILNEEPMSIPEVREALEKVKERDKELTFRANKTEEYVSQFDVLGSKKAAELTEKLTKLNIPRLKDIHIKKIADVLPKTANDVKVVLQGYTVTVKAEHIKKIADTVAGFIPKK
jgi:DNA-directed RNA polymerase subunit F